MRTPKPIHIWDEVFFTNFYVSRGVTPDVFKRQLKLLTNMEYEDNLDKLGGHCLLLNSNSGDRVVWIWTKTMSLSTLAHEVFHAVFQALKGIIKMEDSNEEVFAYLYGFLFDKILKKSRRKYARRS